MKRIFALVLCLLLAGCGMITTGQYRGVSSGLIGCDEDDIQVSEERNVIWSGQTPTWRAECKGVVHICSMVRTTAHCTAEVSAAPVLTSSQATAAQPAPAAVLGCQYDTQCKGDRICEKGVCVSPE